jgi:hypothetical protein
MEIDSMILKEKLISQGLPGLLTDDQNIQTKNFILEQFFRNSSATYLMIEIFIQITFGKIL